MGRAIVGRGSYTTGGTGAYAGLSTGRFSLAVVLSLVCHLGLVGLVIAHAAIDASDSTVPPTFVLVDLNAASPSTSGEPADVRSGPSLDATNPADERSRHMERLTAEDAELTTGLADDQRRTAQLEAEYRQQIAALESAASRLGDEAAALAADTAALAARVEAGRARAAELEAELARRQEAEATVLAELQDAHDRLVAALKSDLAQDKGIVLDAANRRVTVAIGERVLFPSGQATLTTEGRPIIDRIGSVLASLPDPFVLVEGHTDNVPIGVELQSRLPSNWELSSARAAEVVRRLIQHAGTEPERLRAAGRAETRPVAANDTEDGRRRNRRIEIIILPPAPERAS